MTDETTTTEPRIVSGLSRRHALTGAAALGIAVPTLAACGGDAEEAADPAASATPTESATSADPGGQSSSAAPEGFTTTADIPEGGGAIFADQEVVVTQPTAGEFKAFSNICTHQGCPVTEVTSTIDCKCHGSKFSITDGSVANGPATEPLAAVEITVSGDAISLA